MEGCYMLNESSNKTVQKENESHHELALYKRKIKEYEEMINLLETENVILREVAINKQNSMKTVQQLENKIAELQEKLLMAEKELNEKEQLIQGKRKKEIKFDDANKQINHKLGSFYSNTWFMNNLKHQHLDKRPRTLIRKSFPSTKPKNDDRTKE